MEYLITMTTHVPEGTSEETVDDIRSREAARSRELAAQGRLLRLWRPPLQPGEWRTLGLFAADDAGQLGQVLALMPLRVWRTDQITPLSPHPNDPALPAKQGATEFLTTFTVTVPEGTPGQTVNDTEAREAERAKELAGRGHLLRLWMLPTEPSRGHAPGLWRAQDADYPASRPRSDHTPAHPVARAAPTPAAPGHHPPAAPRPRAPATRPAPRPEPGPRTPGRPPYIISGALTNVAKNAKATAADSETTSRSASLEGGPGRPGPQTRAPARVFDRRDRPPRSATVDATTNLGGSDSGADSKRRGVAVVANAAK